MFDAAPLIDAESMVFDLLTAAFSDAYVASEYETDLTFPAVIYSVSGDGQVGNGPGLWTLSLELSFLGPADQAWALAARGYRAVHSWAGTTTAHGHVNAVDDESIPSRVSTPEANAKTTRQYTGVWTLTCRSV
ncbi:hypothetical protein [Puerhibacterium puerhi]|uniref:hypothetical protein n=1 Tax=Puerhibacterium puerhi TaxID=2692623 RepID=UPI0013593B45|nr:hypothetical protein [Puerhibacterium puerhi]